MDWLQSIELEEYIEGFEKMGIHGAFMVGCVPGQMRIAFYFYYCFPPSSFPPLHLSPHFSGLLSPPLLSPTA